MSITMTDIISIIRNIVDICLVWLIIYFILNNLKNNVKLTLLFKGVFFILLLAIVSDIFGFVTIGVLLDYIIQWGPIALIVILCEFKIIPFPVIVIFPLKSNF